MQCSSGDDGDGGGDAIAAAVAVGSTAASGKRADVQPISCTQVPGLQNLVDAKLQAIPVSLWGCIRDYVGWIKMLPLARVCKWLARLTKDPQFWKGLQEQVLDLSLFQDAEHLLALSQVWRESKVSFSKVCLPRDKYQRFNVSDSVLEFLSSTRVQRRCLNSCFARRKCIPGVNIRVTDDRLAYLSALPLQHLNLYGCAAVTDAGLFHLSSLPLQHLNLACCLKITDVGLAHLSALPLKHLNLQRSKAVTEAGLFHLSSLPLQHLDCLIARDSPTLGCVTCLRYPLSTSISVFAMQ